MNLLLAISLVLVSVSLAMLPINHYWRGHALNYSIDFRGAPKKAARRFASDRGEPPLRQNRSRARVRTS